MTLNYKKLLVLLFLTMVIIIAMLPFMLKDVHADTITDLTGTTWQLNSSISYGSYLPTISSGNTQRRTYLTLSVDGISYSGFFFQYYGYSPYCLNFCFSHGDTYVVYSSNTFSSYSSINSSTPLYFSSSLFSSSPIFTITGGSDVTDSTLINWLQANATQVITSTQLDDPVVSYAGSSSGMTLSWSAISNATSYKLGYSSDNETFTYTDIGNVTSYSVSNIGYYKLTAYSSDSSYTESDPSEVVRLSASSSARIPQFGTSAGRIYFSIGSPGEALSSSYGYVVQYADSSSSSWSNVTFSQDDTSTNVYYLSSSLTGYYRVLSYSGSSGSAPGSVIAPSSWSDSYYYNGVSATPLNAPTLSVSGKVLSWTRPSNAPSTLSVTYQLWKSGSLILTTSSTSYTATSQGTYTVVAVGSGSYSNSGYSNEQVLSGTQLTAPGVTTTVADGRTYLQWQPVTGASFYYVYKDSTLFDTVSTQQATGYYICQVTTAGSYTVVSANDNGWYLNSVHSTAVTVSTDSSGGIEAVSDVASIILKAGESIVALVTNMMSFVSVFGNIFAFLPVDIKSLFSAFMIAGISINMFKWFL